MLYFSKVAKNQICTHSWETRVPCRLSICVYLFQKQKLSTFENLSEKPIHSHPLPIFSCEVYLNQTRLTWQFTQKTRIFIHSEPFSRITKNYFFIVKTAGLKCTVHLLPVFNLPFYTRLLPKKSNLNTLCLVSLNTFIM
jgi:hypothetical protein